MYTDLQTMTPPAREDAVRSLWEAGNNAGQSFDPGDDVWGELLYVVDEGSVASIAVYLDEDWDRVIGVVDVQGPRAVVLATNPLAVNRI